MDKESIRLKCLELVMYNGSEMDRRHPLEKSEELYEWVTKERKPERKKVSS